MSRITKFFKRLVFPVTPLVVLAALSLVISIWGGIVIFTTNQPSALLAAIAVALSQVVLMLYVIERLIVRKFPYRQILLGEIFLILFLVLIFIYSITN